MPRFFITTAFAVLLTASSAPDTITVSGSTTVLPAVSRAAEAYAAKFDQTIIVNAGGSGSGFNQLAEGQTDIGMMSRDITNGEREQFPQHSFKEIAIGKDAVAPSVSSEIFEAGVTELSLADIAKIYRGDVDNWAAFGGPDKSIFVIDKEISRGTRQIFMNIVLGDPKADAPGADLVTGSNNEELTALVQSDAAIGMLSLAWLNDDVRGLSITMDDGAAITPTLDNIRNGSYPFVRDINVVTRSDIDPKAKAFVDYLLSPEGQVFVETSGYIKISE